MKSLVIRTLRWTIFAWTLFPQKETARSPAARPSVWPRSRPEAPHSYRFGTGNPQDAVCPGLGLGLRFRTRFKSPLHRLMRHPQSWFVRHSVGPTVLAFASSSCCRSRGKKRVWRTSNRKSVARAHGPYLALPRPRVPPGSPQGCASLLRQPLCS